MTHTRAASLAPADRYRHDQLREDFEQVWQLGGQPLLEDFLDRVPAGQRERLLAELLPLELHHRGRRGELPSAEQYHERFSALSAALIGLFPADGATLNLRRSRPSSLLGATAADRPEWVGPYPVLREIGRGGMGVVLEVYDRKLNRPLAVKLLLSRHREDADLVARFEQEAEINASLSVRGVVAVIDRDRLVDGRPYYAMTLVEGRTLAELLQRRSNLPDSQSRLLGAFAAVCRTMAEVHRCGVIHRDLKPRNLMIGRQGDVTVMDWGLAKRLPTGPAAPAAGSPRELPAEGDLAPLTQAGDFMGTPPYMPPEQARGEVAAQDERCDVFGLGAVLCEILTGQPPYRGTREVVWRKAREADLADAHQRLDECGAPAELIELARRCLEPDRRRRPRDAGAVAVRLQTYLASVEERQRREQERRDRLGLLDEARALLEQTILSGPSCPELHLAVGCVLRRLGRLGDARAAFERALSLGLEDSRAPSRLGDLLLGQKAPAE